MKGLFRQAIRPRAHRQAQGLELVETAHGRGAQGPEPAEGEACPTLSRRPASGDILLICESRGEPNPQVGFESWRGRCGLG